MRLLSTLFLIMGLLLPLSAGAKQPVVVELFTSQGCSACPPADVFVHDLLKEDPSIIVLTWHIDYWNYLGWVDTFSRPENTARQAGYRDYMNFRSLYTPQIVVNGKSQMVGSRADEVKAYIDGVQAQTPVLSFVTKISSGVARTVITPEATGLPDTQIGIVQITPEVTTKVEAGENAGNTFTYVNVVRDLTWVSDWDGKSPIVIDGIDLSDGRYVLIVQARNFGAILGAVYLN